LWKCSSLKEFQPNLNALFEVLVSPMVSAKLEIPAAPIFGFTGAAANIIGRSANKGAIVSAGVPSSSSSSSSSGPETVVMCRLSVRGPGEWPIPENFWVDGRTDHLAPRATHPMFSLLPAKQAGATPGRNEWAQHLALANELGVHADTYEISTFASLYLHHSCTNANRPESLMRTLQHNHHLQLQRDHGDSHYWYGLSVPGSGRGMNSGASTQGPSGAGNTDFPCAVLCVRVSGTSASSMSELIVLPYNFPALFALLRSALEVQRSEVSGQVPPAQQQKLFAAIQEYRVYLSNLPPYYHTPISQLIRKLGLQNWFSKSEEYKLHKNVLKNISRFQENASNDVRAMEIIAKEKIATHIQRHNEYELAASMNVPTGAMAIFEIPTQAQHVPASQLLSTWERMRALIYGGGPGLTVRGLSVDHVHNTTSVVGRDHRAHRGLGFGGTNDWFEQACGGKISPCTSQRQMGNYLEVLARREAGRDPLADPETVLDENSPKERLKR
jgi:hypothetical protein